MAVLDPIKARHRQLSGRDRSNIWTVVEQSWKTKHWEHDTVPFCRELYIDREDFMEDPPKEIFPPVPWK